MSIYEQLRSIFYPKSVAIAGISTSDPEGLSHIFLKGLIEIGFQGQLYLVNPSGGEIGGRKVYQSLAEVPGDVEYVISAVAARVAPELMKACANKGVKVVHFFTSGFAETGEEEGIRLEAEIARIAREAGIRIVGPNCMGAYCPESHISYNPWFAKKSGCVGLISQSGGNCSLLILRAARQGVHFSKAISFGNACDLNESDFLEYLTEDPKTKIIAMYLEGVRDAKRFLRSLKQATKEKTVVLLKGGITEGGNQATLGHTGSLAGSESTWNAICKQYGVIQVASLEELTDVLVTLLLFDLPKGRNAVLLGTGGGSSVIITDRFEKNGLRVPPIPQAIKDRIRSFTPIAGNILRNPIDYGISILDYNKLAETVNIVTKWNGSDFLVVFISSNFLTLDNLDNIPKLIEEIYEATSTSNKPIAFILMPTMIPEFDAITLPAINKIVAKGATLYYTFEGAARAIDLVLKHNRI